VPALTAAVRLRASLGAMLLVALVACDSGGPDRVSPAAGPARDLRSGNCWTTPGSSRADFDGRDGEFAVLLYEVDVGARSLAFDVIQFLVGDDAKREHLRQNPGDTSGPPNDYMTLNALEQVDRATVTATPGVYVLGPDGTSLMATTFEQLPPRPVGRRPGLGLYWLTFQDGLVKEICQQFTP
jgi:hypothetical protein